MTTGSAYIDFDQAGAASAFAGNDLCVHASRNRKAVGTALMMTSIKQVTYADHIFCMGLVAICSNATISIQ